MAVSAARNEQLRRYVENRHIDHIPAGARHGKPWHQFAFWFGGNVNVFNVVLGAVTVSIGLTFWWALIAIAAGTLDRGAADRAARHPGTQARGAAVDPEPGPVRVLRVGVHVPRRAAAQRRVHRRRTGHPGPGHERRHRRADHPGRGS